MYKKYPKVLLINGEPINSYSATGITMSNLFRGWPKDNIFQIYTANIQPDLSFCKNNRKLGNVDLNFLSQISSIYTKYFTRKMLDVTINPNNTNTKTSFLKQSLIRKALIPWIDLIPYHVSSEILKLLREFNPGVIYSTLGNIRFIRLTAEISQFLSVPIVPHFMDDWLSTYSVNGKSLITTLQRSIIKTEAERLLQDVPSGFAICDAMAKEYSVKYGRDFDAFMNPVEIGSAPERHMQSALNANVPVSFVYVGGLHLSRFENLGHIARIISGLHKEGLNVELRIFAPSKDLVQYGPYLEREGAKICGTLSPDDVHKTLCENDVAIHVESFSEKDALYTRLSLSTKIPQYFAAGLPVLAYGPGNVASCRYVVEYGCGKTVGIKDFAALSKAICELASNQELRFQLGRRSLSVAKERHEATAERERFRAALAKAASTTRKLSVFGASN